MNRGDKKKIEEKEQNMISFFSVKIIMMPTPVCSTRYIFCLFARTFLVLLAASANYKNIIIVHDFDVGM